MARSIPRRADPKILNAAQDQSAEIFAESNPNISYCRVGHALRNSYKMDVTTEEAMTNMEEEAEEMFEEKKWT